MNVPLRIIAFAAIAAAIAPAIGPAIGPAIAPTIAAVSPPPASQGQKQWQANPNANAQAQAQLQPQSQPQPQPQPTSAAPRRLVKYEASRMAMGSEYSIVMYGRDADDDEAALARIAEDAFDEVDRLDRLMSHYKADSPLSRLNRDAGTGPVVVDAELFDVIAEAIRYSRESDGAFDITVGPLMKAWGFFRGDGRLPSDAELRDVLARVGYRHVILNAADRTIRFDRPGVELDLGGIGKGYAVDRAVAVLKRHGIRSALVNAGGSTIYGLGAPPREASTPAAASTSAASAASGRALPHGDARDPDAVAKRDGWRVELQDPLDARKMAMTVYLKDRALSVSGSAGKFFEIGGVRYAHIMDPRTGRPVQGMLSVVVLASTGTAGDALDNVFFVNGVAWSRGYIARLAATEVWFFLPEKGGAGEGRRGWRRGSLRSPQAASK